MILGTSKNVLKEIKKVNNFEDFLSQKQINEIHAFQTLLETKLKPLILFNWWGIDQNYYLVENNYFKDRNYFLRYILSPIYRRKILNSIEFFDFNYELVSKKFLF
jgi:hypothetical protein